MKIFRWSFNRSRLARMTCSEGAIFFMLGHAINEINTLNKLFYLANNYPLKEEWFNRAHLAEGLVVSRALIGKLLEGWNLINQAYYGTKLSETYNQLLNDEAKKALRTLKKYFGRENVIRYIRNRFSFHYDAALVAGINPNDLDEAELVAYLAETKGNTIYYSSEYVVNLATLNAIAKANPRAAFEKLVDETTKVTGLFTSAAEGIMAEIAAIYLTERDGTVDFSEIEAGEPADGSTISIPYFLSVALDVKDGTEPAA